MNGGHIEIEQEYGRYVLAADVVYREAVLQGRIPEFEQQLRAASIPHPCYSL